MPLESLISLCLRTSEHSWTCSIRAGRATPCHPLWSTPSLLHSIRSTFQLLRLYATCLALAMRGFSNLSPSKSDDTCQDSDVHVSRGLRLHWITTDALPRIVTCKIADLGPDTPYCSRQCRTAITSSDDISTIALQPPSDRTNAPDTVSLARRASSQMMHTKTDTRRSLAFTKVKTDGMPNGLRLALSLPA